MSYKNYKIEDFVKLILQKKKVKLVNGSFAFAFLDHKGKFVYKIYTNDSAYSQFLKIVETNKSIHYPIIQKHITKHIEFKDFDGMVNIVKLEYLNNEYDIKVYNSDDNTVYIYQPGEFCKLLLNTGLFRFKKLYKCDDYITEQLDSLFLALRPLKNITDSAFDFTTKGNIMMRGNIIVITDPVITYKVETSLVDTLDHLAEEQRPHKK